MQPTTALNRLDFAMSIEEFNARQDREGFIGHRVLPLLDRPKPEGRFPIVKLEQLLQDHETQRNDLSGYSSSDSEFEFDTWLTFDHGHEVPVGDRQFERYEDLVDAERLAQNRSQDIVLRKYEKEVADAVTDTTAYPVGQQSDLVSLPWSDEANSVPLKDIDAARETIVTSFGQEPNALVINRVVMRHLRSNATIIDRLKFQGFVDARPETITPMQLAVSLDLEMVIVADSIQNTANQQQARVISRLWPSANPVLARLCVPGSPAETPCLGRTMIWTPESARDGDRLALITEEYRNDKIRGTVFRARVDYGVKFPIFIEAGVIFLNAVA